MHYTERIRGLREDKDLTQQNVADFLHVGQRTYCDYEKGKTRLPLDSAIRLASFYDVSMDYLTGISRQKNPFPRE